MQTLRLSFLALVLLALSTLTASAQIQTGSTLYFDHDVASVADTQKYQLCVDAVSDAACTDIAVLPLGASQTPDMSVFSFTLPATVPRGNHSLQVRAIGFGDFGSSAGSNALAQRIIGKPLPPVLLRLQQAVTP